MILLVLVGGFLLVGQRPVQTDLMLQEGVLGTADKDGSDDRDDSLVTDDEELSVDEADVPAKSIREDIFVHISGEVNKPGVICLPAGSRVFEAVDKAGGLTEDGDMESINLAAFLADQEKVVVGSTSQRLASGTIDTIQQDPSPIGSTVNSSKININTATKAELETLPGIGPVIAENIVAYRQENGAFRSIEDIKQVKRIGEATFSNIKDSISIR
jgi:competence protein ComEA